ncbi:MAG: hypothetical protein M1834_006520 [Cirrosporium novae-zelandiae]|nr:MAG: hypothetical protein M1834_006520 [Cirrosporium novae-zelandiae]
MANTDTATSNPFQPEESDLAGLPTPRSSMSHPASITAFARFEFEAGKGNDGTKILMVEWEDDDITRSGTGSWHVSWDGKSAVLPANEQMNENTRRMYFMLGPSVTIPPNITLTFEPSPDSAKTVKEATRVRLNPLPAIFPPELGDSATTSGKKGVLHTIWAKKRLQALEKEIEAEKQYNLEGIALEMAIQEKQWIESNFGVGSRPPPLLPTGMKYPSGPLSPGSPKSPSGKLSEKLKGLKVGTGEKDLMRRPEVNHEAHPLSPESPDVAVSSFASFRNTPVSADSSKSAAVPRTIAYAPPPYVQAQQKESGIASIDKVTGTQGYTTEDEQLFAKALSPRTPDIPRSPFSFSPHKTLNF